MMFDLKDAEPCDVVISVNHAHNFPVKVSFRKEPSDSVVEGFRNLRNDGVMVDITEANAWVLKSLFFTIEALAETIAVQLEAQSLKVKRSIQTEAGPVQKVSFNG